MGLFWSSNRRLHDLQWLPGSPARGWPTRLPVQLVKSNTIIWRGWPDSPTALSHSVAVNEGSLSMRISTLCMFLGVSMCASGIAAISSAYSYDGIESARLVYDQWNLASKTVQLSQSGFRKVYGNEKLDYTKESRWSVHDQECVLSGHTTNHRQKTAEAFLRNHQYSATLQENETGKWIVKELVLGAYDDKAYNANPEKRNTRDEVLNLVSAGTPFRTPWQILPGNDDFMICVKNGIVKISGWSKNGDGSETASFTFENKQFALQGKGEFTFHSEYRGMPLRAEIEFTAPDGTVGKSFIDNSDFVVIGKYAFPKKWRRWSEHNGKTTTEEEYVLNQFTLPSSIPRSTFTLTAFGLPEPPGTTVLHTPFPYWLAGTIVGVLLIAGGFYLRSRKA